MLLAGPVDRFGLFLSGTNCKIHVLNARDPGRKSILTSFYSFSMVAAVKRELYVWI